MEEKVDEGALGYSQGPISLLQTSLEEVNYEKKRLTHKVLC